MRRGYDRSWTVLLNAANQMESFRIPQPNAEGLRWRLRAWIGANSQGVNVLLMDGDLTLVPATNKISPGAMDAKMVVPPGGVGEVESDAINYLTVLADAVPAGNIFVTVRLTQC